MHRPAASCHRGVSDALWSRAVDLFTESELADLLYLIGVMNLFNRLNVATEFPAQLWRERGIAASKMTRRKTIISDARD